MINNAKTVIGIVGSRRRSTSNDFDLVKKTFLKVCKKYKLDPYNVIICSGGCYLGADSFAETIAKQDGYSILIHYPKSPPDGSPRFMWTKLLHKRNTKIANDSDILIACVAPDRKGGTEDTIKKFGNKKHLYLI